MAAHFEGDPRHALSAVVDRYAANGWRVEAAFEMEFYLLSATTPELVPLWSGRPGGNTLSVTALDEAEAFFQRPLRRSRGDGPRHR